MRICSQCGKPFDSASVCPPSDDEDAGVAICLKCLRQLEEDEEDVMKTAIERAIGVWRGLNNGVEYGGAYATQQIRKAIQEAMDEALEEAAQAIEKEYDGIRFARIIRALKVGE